MDSETLLRGIQMTQSQFDDRFLHLTQRSSNKVNGNETSLVDRLANASPANGNNRLNVKQDIRPDSYAGSLVTLNKFPRMHLKLFVNESTFTERLRFYFIKNQTTSLRIRLFRFFLKLLSVVLYCIRAGLDDRSDSCCGMCVNASRVHNEEGLNPDWYGQYNFSSSVIFWVDRPYPIWCMQVVLAIIGFLFEVINTYANYKGNLTQQLLSLTWFFEIFVCGVPFIITIFWEPLKCLFIPVFFNIWMAKAGLESIVNDLHRVAHKQQSAMFNQVCILISTLLCLFVTCICGVQHLERAGKFPMDLFDAFWFVVVTFSTVGYGDITPTIWPSRLVVIVIIFLALSILPTQLEQISFLYAERQRQGGEYSRQRAKTEKHVVVCATVLRMDVILELLNEFYSHPALQNYFVVLLSPVELDGPLKRFLQIPIWAERVIYIHGSVLRDMDMIRVKMDAAEACFMLTSRQEIDRVAADEKTILRAMAVKDFAPRCPLYVQILRPESMLHVQFADKVICDEEFKYVLLAMNSYIPGISTLITLLAHTSKGQEGDNLNSEWKREFGRSAGNEIYSVCAEKSKFFGTYIGQKFSTASLMAHSKYGATLFAAERGGDIRMNPGSDFIIDPEDTLFYICLTQEEDAMIVEDKNDRLLLRSTLSAQNTVTETLKGLSSLDQGRSFDDTQNEVFDPDAKTPHSDHSSSFTTTMGRTKIGFPPVTPYAGHNTPTMCHVLEEKAKLCCLRLERPCEHCRFTSAFHYNWPSPPIIVSAESAPSSLFNVMLPLRAHYRSRFSLHPIILLLENSPEDNFLDAISCFPMVYYMLGGMNRLDPLLNAGILRAHTVIIMDRETSMNAEEEYMADSRQLVATQTMFRLFPTTPTCLELTHATNMRFMHFDPPDAAIDPNEFRKEREKEKSCSLPYLFRKAFASGKVFSSSMLDTLLYQSFVKDYLTTLLRIMLGLQYSAGSGYLSTYKVAEKDIGRTYHEMFRCLSRKSGCIVLGVYRYEDKAPSASLSSFVRSTMSDDSFSGNSDLLEGTKTKSRSKERVSSIGEDPYITPKRKSLANLSIDSMKKSLRSKFKGSTHSDKRQNLRRLHLEHSKRSDRQKLDEMIQFRMRELDLTDKAFGSPAKNKDCIDRFGYIILNPTPDLVLQTDDILYIINPEMDPCDSYSCSSSCLSEQVDDFKSVDEEIAQVTPVKEKNKATFKKENELLSKMHRISAIDEEIDGTIEDYTPSIFENETTKV